MNDWIDCQRGGGWRFGREFPFEIETEISYLIVLTPDYRLHLIEASITLLSVLRAKFKLNMHVTLIWKWSEENIDRSHKSNEICLWVYGMRDIVYVINTFVLSSSLHTLPHTHTSTVSCARLQRCLVGCTHTHTRSHSLCHSQFTWAQARAHTGLYTFERNSERKMLVVLVKCVRSNYWQQ